MIRVEHVLGAWKTLRADTAQSVEDMPPGELEFKPLPELATFGELARHILHASHALTGMLLAGVEDMTRDFRGELAKHTYPIADDAGAAALAATLRQALEERAAELERQSPEWWAHIVTRFDGQRVTRLEMVQMTKEHEITHLARMFMYLRLKGMVPATTRRRQAARQPASR